MEGMTSSDRLSGATTGLDLWRLRVQASPQGVGFRHPEGGGWREVTWSQADAEAREVAAGFVALGVRPGDRICILSQTRYEWWLADLASMLAGAVPVPIYATTTADQCAYVVNDCGAKIVLVEDAAQLEKMVSVREKLTTVSRVVYIGGDARLDRPDEKGRTEIALGPALAAAGAFAHSFQELREQGRRVLATGAGTLEARGDAITPNTPFTIIYTSGTTGNPKGVVLSHANVVAALEYACRALTVSEVDAQYLWLPLAHVLGRELAWAAIRKGAVTWFSRGVNYIKDDLGVIRPTFMAGVPRIYEKFYQGVQAALAQGSPLKKKIAAWAVNVGREASAAAREGRPLGAGLALRAKVAEALVFKKLRRKLGLDRCRFLISGGAPLAPEIAAFFHAAGLLVLEGYGLTETVGAAFVNRLDRFRFGTVGPALDNVEVKIADDGEVLMRGPTVFKQYFNNPEATREALDEEGWFHSGDIGHLEDGFLRLTDRKKDLIVTAGGKKIAPQPIENALKMRARAISQAVVYGDKRPFCVALFTLTEDALKSRSGDAEGFRREVQEAVDAVNATLAPYETIKRFAILPHDLTEARGEITPSLKVKRKVVLERYRDAFEQLYAGAP
jgi:long-chain acyl-CoA synthetase